MPGHELCQNICYKTILLNRFSNYGTELPYTPNYNFPNLAATSGAPDWPDYSGVDSTTSTPFESRQTPEAISNLGGGNVTNTLDNPPTGWLVI